MMENPNAHKSPVARRERLMRNESEFTCRATSRRPDSGGLQRVDALSHPLAPRWLSLGSHPVPAETWTRGVARVWPVWEPPWRRRASSPGYGLATSR